MNYLIQWYLMNRFGPLGYRHSIAHRWASSEDGNLQLAAMTIQLTLKVVGIIWRIEGRLTAGCG
jgi:hypothetical protein